MQPGYNPNQPPPGAGFGGYSSHSGGAGASYNYGAPPNPMYNGGGDVTYVSWMKWLFQQYCWWDLLFNVSTVFVMDVLKYPMIACTVVVFCFMF